MANDFSALPFEIGSTYFAGQTATDDAASSKWEGKEFIVPSMDWSSSSPAKYRAYGGANGCGWYRIRVVRNKSGITLSAGAIVQFTNAAMLRISGLCEVADSPDYKPLDEFLPSTGCLNNDLCYVVMEGIASYRVSVTPAEGVVTAGSVIYGVTAAASTHTTTAGRGYAGAQIGAATTHPANKLIGRIGVALSASTTNETGSLKLARIYA